VQVTAYGWQTVPDRRVVRSCDLLQNLGASIISLQRLNLNSSNFVHKSAILILATGWHITNKRGVIMVTWLFQNFCRLSWCSASRGFVIDCWATCCILKYVYDVVIKSSHLLSHLLMSFFFKVAAVHHLGFLTVRNFNCCFSFVGPVCIIVPNFCVDLSNYSRDMAVFAISPRWRPSAILYFLYAFGPPTKSIWWSL